MKKEKLIEKLKNLFKEKPTTWNHFVKKDQELFSFLLSETKFLDILEKVPMALRKQSFIEGLHDFPECPVCGNKIKKYRTPENRYSFQRFCSKKCLNSEEGKRICRDKFEESMLKKYGVKHAMHTEEAKEKLKKTCRAKYGTDHFSKAEEVKTKRKNTVYKRYGVSNIMRNKYSKEKLKNTLLKKYGVTSPAKHPNIKAKIKKTNTLRYGYNTYTKSEEYIRKYRSGRYNLLVKYLKSIHIKLDISEEEFLTFRKGDIVKYSCTNCEKQKEFTIDYRGIKRELFGCVCSRYRKSYGERALANWFSDIGVNYETNKMWDRTFETDIFLPEYKLAVEFHGLYWHSSENKEKNYHLKKFKFFKEKGVNLIQIFENEWVNKQDIVKSIIKHKLGLAKQKIYARKCTVQEVPFSDYKIFCEENHIQGYATASVRLGLYYNNKLVQLTSYSKSRFNKKYEYEHIRGVTKKDTVIIGGATKLFKYFLNRYEPNSIISYVDKRYFDGKSYKRIYKQLTDSKPNYFYFKKHEKTIYPRNQFQKHMLKNKLETFDPNKTEYENMKNNGYLRIYDAGNMVFTYKKPM